MTNTVLRDYQQEMLERLHLAWEQHQSVMVQMPTGVGKTILLAEEIKNEKLKVKNEKLKIDSDELKNNSEKGGVLVVAHRIELIDQISRTLDKFGIEHGLIVSGKPVEETKQVQVASIQTLARNEKLKIKSEKLKVKNEGLKIKSEKLKVNSEDFSLIIIDEAHHALAKMAVCKVPRTDGYALQDEPCRLCRVVPQDTGVVAHTGVHRQGMALGLRLYLCPSGQPDDAEDSRSGEARG